MGVPEHRNEIYRGRRNDFCLCVFVLNEGERIRRQLAKMRPYAEMVDIVVVDGGSTDGALGEGMLRENGVTALLIKTGPGGLSAQMRIGFQHALQKGYAGVIVMDGNDKDDPSAIPLFIDALRAGYDHVQGSRFIAGGVHRNTPLERMLAVRFIHAPLISLASGRRCTDTTNGFRAYSRRLLDDPRVLPLRDVFQRYELHYYLAIRSALLGLRTVEVPVSRIYPEGKAPTKIKGLKGNASIVLTLMKACLRRFDPK